MGNERNFIAKVVLDSIHIIPIETKGKIISGLGENFKLSIGKIKVRIIIRNEILVKHKGNLQMRFLNLTRMKAANIPIENSQNLVGKRR